MGDLPLGNVADNETMNAAAEFHLHDQVRLTASSGDLRQGSVGRVLGWFARPDRRTCAVVFESERRVVEVPPDALERLTAA